MLSVTVSLTHDAVGDLPGVVQQAEVSPVEGLPGRDVGQPVPGGQQEQTDWVRLGTPGSRPLGPDPSVQSPRSRPGG